MDVLETGRLRLRPLDAGDEALYVSLYTDPDVMHHIAPAMSREAATASFAKARGLNARADPRYRSWIIVQREEAAGIGLLALMGDSARAEIGAMIAPAWQNRGIAEEAIRRLVDYAFDECGIAEVFTRHHPDNPLAGGLMRKLDFTRVPSLPLDDGRIRWRLQRHDRRPGREITIEPASTGERG